MASQTKTEWFKWNLVVQEIQRMEGLGWSVKLLFPTKRVVGSTVNDGFLVVFEEPV